MPPSNSPTIEQISPRRHKATKAIDKMAYIVGVGGNIAVIPQIIKAWESNAPGLAVMTWLLFSGIGLIWLAYAILHNQKPLIVAQSVSICCNLMVVTGWIFNHWIV
jgi:MtN3 and saliva related transmembrane protein